VLEILPRENVTKDVHRFANLSHLAVFAKKKGLTIKEIIDVIAFDRGDVTKELIEGPFQRKQLFGNKFVHYSVVRCRFSGDVVDLRPKLAEWPELISDDDYTFCNGLGKEANDGGLGGFLSPSARNFGGTTVPAFLPWTISHPQIEATARLAFDGADVIVEVKELP
jgi:hypothetical protein